MTPTLFLIIFTIESLISAAVTEFIKTLFTEKKISYNLLAIIDAVVVGGLGTVFAYALMGVTWNMQSIVCIPCLMLSVAMGSMLGYDKVKQLIEQIIGIKGE